MFAEHEEPELNFFFWRDEIEKIINNKSSLAVVKGRPISCYTERPEPFNLSCGACDFGDDIVNCQSDVIKWLYSPHETEKDSMYGWRLFSEEKPPIDEMVLISNGNMEDIRSAFLSTDFNNNEMWETGRHDYIEPNFYKWWCYVQKPPGQE